MARAPETILLLIGTDRDPMPQEPKRTRYWVAAGPCRSCGHTERRLWRAREELVVECTRCGGRTGIGIPADALREVSFVFWCSSPHFESDDVPLSRQEREEIERLLSEFAQDVEPTFFGVVIEAGICRRTKDCINDACPYNRRAVGGPASWVGTVHE